MIKLFGVQNVRAMTNPETETNQMSRNFTLFTKQIHSAFELITLTKSVELFTHCV